MDEKKKNNSEISGAEATPLETVEPIGKRVLIRKDEDKKFCLIPKAQYRSTSKAITGCSSSKWKM